MKKPALKRTLRTIPRYLTLLSLALLTSFGILFFYLTNLLGQKRSLDFFDGMSSKGGQSVSSYLDEIERMANLAAYSRSVQEYLFESTPYKRAQAQRAATDLITNIMSFSPSICEIAFYKRDGSLLQMGGEYATLIRTAAEEQELNLREKGEKGFFSQVVYNVSIPSDVQTPYFLFVYPIYSVIEGEFSAEPNATCLVLARVKDLVDRHMEGMDAAGTFAALMEGEKLVFSSRPLDDYGEEQLTGAPEGGSVLMLNGEKSLAFRHHLDGTPWNAVIIASEAELSRDLIPIKIVISVYILLGIIMQCVLLSLGTRQITAPIQRLVGNIRKLDLDRDIHPRIVPEQIEEIELLCGSINELLDRLDQMEHEQEETRNKLYQASLLKEQAQLKYYRSQINPHFLYNTLECISSMARLSRIDAVQQMCTSMADLFRYSVSDSAWVTVRQEVAHAENYYNVIAQRTTSGRYNLKVHISPEDCDRRMQKMVLQPLIENSIKHGFAGKEAPCNILIRLRGENGGVCLLVADNGFGIPPARLKKLNQRLQSREEEGAAETGESVDSIGLFNIHRRLRLASGGKSRMQLESRYGYYTCVKIWLPAEEEWN